MFYRPTQDVSENSTYYVVENNCRKLNSYNGQHRIICTRLVTLYGPVYLYFIYKIPNMHVFKKVISILRTGKAIAIAQ